ncbi:hypothetical protein [Gemmata obscuriglobus]|uniref:hypothetical protein n=1 Tax=Gemmata obscuriglobus TaxID=114 RepID=UPI0011CE6F4A|nr:hypothetical protein [Gemmata obscuriglobus]
MSEKRRNRPSSKSHDRRKQLAYQADGTGSAGSESHSRTRGRKQLAYQADGTRRVRPVDVKLEADREPEAGARLRLWREFPSLLMRAELTLRRRDRFAPYAGSGKTVTDLKVDSGVNRYRMGR